MESGNEYTLTTQDEDMYFENKYRMIDGVLRIDSVDGKYTAVIQTSQLSYDRCCKVMGVVLT